MCIAFYKPLTTFRIEAERNFQSLTNILDSSLRGKKFELHLLKMHGFQLPLISVITVTKESIYDSLLFRFYFYNNYLNRIIG